MDLAKSTLAYETQLYTVQDSIAEMRLNKPALSLLDEIVTFKYHQALGAADADAEVRMIILCVNGEGLPVSLICRS